MSFVYPIEYDVIVVGAGHAGCEAALAAARLGRRVLVLTGNIETIAHMSCNPAIGGVAKGHLVREIDALGGEMARAIDETGIHFRRLNTCKGPAVRSTRAQADKLRYRARMRRALEGETGISLKQAEVTALCTDESGPVTLSGAAGTRAARQRVVGVETQGGVAFRGRAVVLTTGTFLRGVIHVGEESRAGGRAGEAPAASLSASLMRLGFPLARLKTGTPCRLDGRTIDRTGLEVQAGDTPPPRFSWWTDPASAPPLPQVVCWVTYTSPRTHQIIRDNLHRSPLYAGRIEGVGPRYCPSIEDKVVRFADKERHQIFLEPEGIDTHEVYPNGVSTSLPYEVQLAFMRSIGGLERVELLRPGYAVEYDFVNPTELEPWLETRRVAGLFHAGQLNGTSGYEEAAAQGQLAGINAALATAPGEVRPEPFVLGRDEAYGGVLVDDLCTRGTEEPYRIMTARAEYRLSLREHNVDERLLPRARALGLCPDARWRALEAGQVARAGALAALAATRVAVSAAVADVLGAHGTSALREPASLLELLRRPELDFAALARVADAAGVRLPELGAADAERLEVDLKYQGYLAREATEANRQRELEHVHLGDLDYSALAGLSREAREKLERVRPTSVGQAARIPGVTPAAISVLLVHTAAERRRRGRTAAKPGA